MRLDDAPESANVEDRRGQSAGIAAAGGGGILMIILALVFGGDVAKLAGGRGGQPPVAGAGMDDDTKKFIAKVLGTTEKVWEKEFARNNYVRAGRQGRAVGEYVKPRLVIFSDSVNTGCGTAPSAVGPFYCPADSRVYLDPSFFDELAQKLKGSKGQFSQAYVVAHEVGHHVQNLIGYNTLADARRKTRQENEYSIRLELQADYLAGVWAHEGNKEFKFIQPGDVDDALKTALAIGDDRIQKQMQGKTFPESYNHGTAQQRAYFFKKGLDGGDATQATLDKFFTAPFGSDKEIDYFLGK